jgi:hypothetical protein
LSIHAQNLFDAVNTVRYADYLYRTENYKTAAEEYQRAVFLCPDSLPYKIRLIQSYNKCGMSEKALTQTQSFFGTNYSLYSTGVSDQYAHTLSLLRDTAGLRQFVLSESSLHPQNKSLYKFGLVVLQNDPPTVDNFVSQNKFPPKFDPQVRNILRDAQSVKHKNPYLAAGLSTLIPGAGKVYTKNYSDGIIVLSLVAINAWQAYRGFRKEGQSSVYGWIFGSLSACFYLGNIYGSAKAARKYNQKIDSDLENKVFDMMNEIGNTD